MLDNGSRDGSAEAARAHADGRRDDRARARAAARRSTTPSCCGARAGATRCCSTRTPSCCPGATLALWQALEERPAGGLRGRAAAAPRRHARRRARGAFPRRSRRSPGALFLHRLLTVQSRGERTREVDWCQSAALLVRREAAAQVGYLDPDFFVYSDEVDFARRLRDAGWHSAVRARRRAPSTTSSSRPTRCRSGGSWSWRATATCTCASTTPPAAARAVRWLTAWSYALRALAALALPGHAPRALLAPRDARRCTRSAARACARRPPRTTVGRPGTDRCRPEPPTRAGRSEVAQRVLRVGLDLAVAGAEARPRAGARRPPARAPARARAGGRSAVSSSSAGTSASHAARASEATQAGARAAAARRRPRPPTRIAVSCARRRHSKPTLKSAAREPVDDDEHRRRRRRTARCRRPRSRARRPTAGTSASSSTTLTARPAAAAGRLREVTRARPAIATNTRYSPYSAQPSASHGSAR